MSKFWCPFKCRAPCIHVALDGGLSRRCHSVLAVASAWLAAVPGEGEISEVALPGSSSVQLAEVVPQLTDLHNPMQGWGHVGEVAWHSCMPAQMGC